MAIAITIKPGSNFDNQLINGVKFNVSRKLVQKTTIRSGNIQNKVSNVIRNTLNQTEVIQSLNGVGDVDLAAHFGLKDNVAKSLSEGIIDLSSSSIQILTSIIRNGASIRLRAISTNWDKYEILPGASYISYPSKITIPVIRWILVDPNIDIGAASYDIVFSGEGGAQFERTIRDRSRSGRAIMVSLEELGGTGGYVLPDIIRHPGGRNFIENAFDNNIIKKQIGQIIFNEVK